MKVYVVTAGEYSDYHIEAIFSIKEKAEEYKVQADRASRYHDNRSIEEWELDQPIPVLYTEVEMDKDGNVQFAQLVFGDVELGFKYFGHQYHSGKPFLFWVVATEDRERAIKVVNEKRAQIIANDLWGKDKEVRELFGAGG